MKKLLAVIFAGMFAFALTSPVIAAAEKKEAAKKVDCKDAKNKDNKDCVKKAKK